MSFRSGIVICDRCIQHYCRLRGIRGSELSIVAVGLTVQLVEHVCDCSNGRLASILCLVGILGTYNSSWRFGRSARGNALSLRLRIKGLPIGRRVLRWWGFMRGSNRFHALVKSERQTILGEKCAYVYRRCARRMEDKKKLGFPWSAPSEGLRGVGSPAGGGCSLLLPATCG